METNTNFSSANHVTLMDIGHVDLLNLISRFRMGKKSNLSDFVNGLDIKKLLTY